VNDGPKMPDRTITDIRCSCGDHLIQLDSWSDGDLFMTTWKPIPSKKWGRFRWAWRSLRGRWSGDNEVVLDPEAIRELRDALTKHIERNR
jgi:hypothetical protein